MLPEIKSLLTSITPVIFMTDLPDTPDNLITLYLAGGFPPMRTFNGGNYDRPSFQVRIRHVDAATAIQWAEQVKDTLAPINDLTINSVRFIDISQTGDILPLGKDAKGRTGLTINFQTKLDRSV